MWWSQLLLRLVILDFQIDQFPDKVEFACAFFFHTAENKR